MSDIALAIRRDELLPDAETWRTTTQMAEAFFKSGLLPSSVKTPQAAALIIQAGRERNLPPTFALAHIHVIEGNPTTDAQVIGALIYREHGDNALIPVSSTAQVATYRYKRRGWADWQEFSYTIEDAKTAGLVGKRNWRENPAAMLRARCVSAIGRLAFQDVVGGLYTGEEIAPDLLVNEHGGILSIRETPRAEPTDDEPVEAEPEPTEGEYRDAPAKGTSGGIGPYSAIGRDKAMALLSDARKRAKWSDETTAAWLVTHGVADADTLGLKAMPRMNHVEMDAMRRDMVNKRWPTPTAAPENDEEPPSDDPAAAGAEPSPAQLAADAELDPSDEEMGWEPWQP